MFIFNLLIISLEEIKQNLKRTLSASVEDKQKGRRRLIVTEEVRLMRVYYRIKNSLIFEKDIKKKGVSPEKNFFFKIESVF